MIDTPHLPTFPNDMPISYTDQRGVTRTPRPGCAELGRQFTPRT